jgi:hypothetical protein
MTSLIRPTLFPSILNAIGNTPLVELSRIMQNTTNNNRIVAK